MITTILAIDLGKYNCVLCWYEPDARTTIFRMRTVRRLLLPEKTFDLHLRDDRPSPNAATRTIKTPPT